MSSFNSLLMLCTTLSRLTKVAMGSKSKQEEGQQHRPGQAIAIIPANALHHNEG